MIPETHTRYPFQAQKSLVAEGKVLAKCYKVSFNMLLTLLLEHAVEEWLVPGMLPKARPGELEDEQKSLT